MPPSAAPSEVSWMLMIAFTRFPVVAEGHLLVARGTQLVLAVEDTEIVGPVDHDS